jgi:hypothetical protein
MNRSNQWYFRGDWKTFQFLCQTFKDPSFKTGGAELLLQTVAKMRNLI